MNASDWSTAMKDVMTSGHAQKHRALVKFIASIVFVAASPASFGTNLFEDNFASGKLSSEWVSRACCQFVQDGRMHTVDTDGWPRDSLVLVHDGDANWTDYTLSVDAGFVPGTPWEDFSILLKARGFDWTSGGAAGSAYRINFHGTNGWDEPNQNRVALIRLDVTPGDIFGRTLIDQHFDPPAQPMKITATVAGNHVKVTVNGELLFDAIDPDPLPYGGIGFHAVWESEAQFDNVVVSSPSSGFSAFSSRAEFTLGPKANDDSYWVRGWLKLADTSNGINPLTEAVTIKVGPFSQTLPAGSFTQEGDSYVFKGPVGASVLDVRITGSSTPGGYSFKSCLKKADLEATTLKPQAQLSIGDDQGQATLDVGYAKFGKGVDGQKWVFPPVD